MCLMSAQPLSDLDRMDGAPASDEYVGETTAKERSSKKLNRAVPARKQNLKPIAHCMFQASDIHPVSAKEYAQAVRQHAQQPLTTTIYPGEVFEHLATYLWRYFVPQAHHNNSVYTPQSTAPANGFATVVSLYEQKSNSKPFMIKRLSQADDLPAIDVCAQLSTADDRCTIDGNAGRPESFLLFLNGHPSPQWLTAIGSRYQVDPRYFQSHLEFRTATERRNCFAWPSLPSSTDDIIRIRMITLGAQVANSPVLGLDLESIRLHAEKRMGQYFRDLNTETNVQLGDSVVRRFNIHDMEHYSLEQEVSVCFQKHSAGWLSMYEGLRLPNCDR